MPKSIKYDRKLRIPVSINDKYTVSKMLGKGGFGYVFSARAIGENTDKFAIKVERLRHKNGKLNRRPQLFYEYRIYKHLLKSLQIRDQIDFRCFPLLYEFIQSKDRNDIPINLLVMQRMGPNIETIFASHDRKFSVQNVVAFGVQIVRCIEALHRSSIIHRDIKPENFCVGSNGDEDSLFIVDFGLAKCFINKTTSEHIPYRDDKSLTGTPRYASLNCHRGAEQSRRDDLESCVYILAYLIRGNLPWQRMKGSTKKKKYIKIRDMKAQTKAETLFHGQHSNFAAMFTYCRELEFEESPDYVFLQKLLMDVIPTSS